MWKICRGEWNLAIWPTEFGKTCRWKLWSLMLMCAVSDGITQYVRLSSLTLKREHCTCQAAVIMGKRPNNKSHTSAVCIVVSHDCHNGGLQICKSYLWLTCGSVIFVKFCLIFTESTYTQGDLYTSIYGRSILLWSIGFRRRCWKVCRLMAHA